MEQTLAAPKTPVLDELLDLICEDIQIGQERFDRATTSYGAVSEWLRHPDSPVRAYGPDIFPQGSLRLDTTVRPLSHTEFDLDLVCLVNYPECDCPSEVYELLCDRVMAHGTYAPKVVRMPRCIRLDYEGDFHLDIVPAVPDPAAPPGAGGIRIPDREMKVWRASNPRGYSEWFEAQARKRKLVEKYSADLSRSRVEPLRQPAPASEKHPLKLAVQLLKRWRDVEFEGREGLAPSSIVLTTLAGRLYDGDDHPTQALHAILNGVYDLANQGPIRLTNPSNPSECITDRWSQKPEAYEAFLASVFDFRVRWQKLLADGRLPGISEELKALFEEAPVARAFVKFAERRERASSEGRLYSDRSSGRLLVRTPAAPAPAASIPVARHTFHGRG